MKYSSGEGYQTAHRCSLSRQLSFPHNYLFEWYRFTSQSIIYIHNLIRPYICNITNRSHALTSQQILCVALRFFANGSFLYNVGDAEHLSKATVCRTVRKVCLAMKRLLRMFVVFPGHKPVRAIKEVLGVDSEDELPPGIPSATGIPIYWLRAPLPPLEVAVLGHHPFHGHLPSFCWLSRSLC